MAANEWLIEKLNEISGVRARAEDDLVYAAKEKRTFLIYCPESDRYLVTLADVQEGISLGATVVAHPARMQASPEAVAYGHERGARVIVFATLFGLLSKK